MSTRRQLAATLRQIADEIDDLPAWLVARMSEVTSLVGRWRSNRDMDGFHCRPCADNGDFQTFATLAMYQEHCKQWHGLALTGLPLVIEDDGGGATIRMRSDG